MNGFDRLRVGTRGGILCTQSLTFGRNQDKKFIEEMSDCQLLKKDSDTWRYAAALEQSSYVKGTVIQCDL